MTANEMANELELKLDRSSSYGSPGYEDFELSSVLSEAQMFYVKKFFSEDNNREGKGFEETEIRDQGFGALVKDAPALTPSASQTGVIVNTSVTGKFFDLPTDHMFTIYEECLIDKTVCGTNGEEPIYAYVISVAHNEMQRFNTSKYKKPFYKAYGTARVWRSEFSRTTTGINPGSPATPARHELFTDGTFNIVHYHIRYIKLPSDIVVDRDTTTNQRNCEFAPSTHRTIIDIAADLMMQRTKDQKMQIIEPFKELE
jgi:hypothetical protein